MDKSGKGEKRIKPQIETEKDHQKIEVAFLEAVII